jgi:hypothetical protein
MKKLLKKILAPIVRQLVQEEIERLNYQPKSCKSSTEAD